MLQWGITFCHRCLKARNLFWCSALFTVRMCLSASFELLKKSFAPAWVSQWELEEVGHAWVSCQVQVVCCHRRKERAAWDRWVPHLSLGRPRTGRPVGVTCQLWESSGQQLKGGLSTRRAAGGGGGDENTLQGFYSRGNTRHYISPVVDRAKKV